MMKQGDMDLIMRKNNTTSTKTLSQMMVLRNL